MKSRLFRLLFLSCISGLLLACGPEIHPSTEWPDQGNEPESEIKAKPRYICIDAAANFPVYANSKENIARDLRKVKESGFTDIVVDVRPTSGDVLFNSSVVDQVKFLFAWVNGVYTKVVRTADWDYLQAFIDEGHKIGLKVHAIMNTFVGGREVRGEKMGVLFKDSEKASQWATILNTTEGPVSIMEDHSKSEKFMNPSNPDVQDYIFSILKEVSRYDLDGIILDRGRYYGLQSDFSELTKSKFEEFIGGKVKNFPEDILPLGATSAPSTYSQYLTKWFEFRCKTIHDFMVKARDVVKSVNPDIMFGVYVGGWYASYYDVGVNWAAPSFDPSLQWKWANSTYKTWGYADHMDHMLIGAYANPKNIYGTTEWTMQGFCLQAKAKAGSGCNLVVGGPDIGNWDPNGIYSQEEENDAVTKSVEACINACDGYFLFDIVRLRQADQWDYVKAGIDSYLKSIGE